MQNSPASNDDDNSTCEIFSAGDYGTILTPIPITQNESVIVTVLTERDPICPPYSPDELYPMMKELPGPPVRTSFIGSFQKCQYLEHYEESPFVVQTFNCTCVSGICADVFVRVIAPCGLKLCEVKV